MSLYGMLRTGASGMAAQSNKLGTVAENIANVATSGFKRSSTEFSSLVLPGNGRKFISGAVETTVRYHISEAGNLNFSTSTTDLAISGNGFFAVSGPDGNDYLTRAGSFVPDAEGKLINAAGYALLGYDISGGDVTGIVNSTAALEEINIGNLTLAANPSQNGVLTANLPAGATVVAAANLPSANAATATATNTSSIIAFDNLGEQVTLDIYYTKTAASTWEVAVFDRADKPVGGGFPYAAGPLVTQTLTFDVNGQLDGASATDVAIPVPNGATLTLDLGATTQLATDYDVRNASVDGSNPGSAQSIEFTPDGYLYAIYSDGTRVATHRVPLAIVNSPDNLRPMAGTVFAVTNDSGNVEVGFPGSSGAYGQLVSGALEGSTVDLASELTGMIEAQRNYTANSKVFQTGADLLDVLVNLKR